MFPRKRAMRIVVLGTIALLAAFLAWRFVRPMDIFVVSDAFARPIDTTASSSAAPSLSAAACGACHPGQYAEWKTSIHSRAWSDAYFQVDWAFDDRQQVCKNCHIPLDVQQENRVLGFRDSERLQPILEANRQFDASLQAEGVTCAACHVREGKIVGPRAVADAPHPVEKLADANEICVRCHVVQGRRWDTFYWVPPCGTTAEIGAGGEATGGEYRVRDVAALGCVQCHMPEVGRSPTDKNGSQPHRAHLWRGGHDRDMVRSALAAKLAVTPASHGSVATLELANVGAAHFLPTGTPDRHLTVRLRAVDAGGAVLAESNETLERLVMWRPFIVDLRDTRLVRGTPRRYDLELPPGTRAVEAAVRYHLLAESRRARIDYHPAEPISYPVFEQRIPLP